MPNSPHWLQALGAKPMYLGLDLRGGVHFLLQVDMKAAANKSVERYLGDVRGLLRDKKIYYSGIARDGDRIVIRFREADQRAAALKLTSTPRCRTSRSASRTWAAKAPLIGLDQARGGQARAGAGAAAEHPDAAQPRERAGRRRAHRAAAGRRPHRGAACRRAGSGYAPRTSSAAPRPSKCASSPRSTPRAPGKDAFFAVQGPAGALRHRQVLRPGRRAGAGEEERRHHRRPHQGFAAGLRLARSRRRGRGAHGPGRHRRAHHPPGHARERQEAHGDDAGGEEPAPRSSPGP